MNKRLKIWLFTVVAAVFFVPASCFAINTQQWLELYLQLVDQYDPEADPCTYNFSIINTNDEVTLGMEELKKIFAKAKECPPKKYYMADMLLPQIQTQLKYNQEFAHRVVNALVSINKQNPGQPAIRKNIVKLSLKDGRINCFTGSIVVDLILEGLTFSDEERVLIHDAPDGSTSGHIFNAYKGKDGTWIYTDITLAGVTGNSRFHTVECLAADFEPGIWKNPKLHHVTHFVKQKDGSMKDEPYGTGDIYHSLFNKKNPHILEDTVEVDDAHKVVKIAAGLEKIDSNYGAWVDKYMRDHELWNYPVVLDKSVEQIEPYAFAGCLMFTVVDASKTQISQIPDYCFTDCENLKLLLLPKSVMSLGRKSLSQVLNKDKSIFLIGDKVKYNENYSFTAGLTNDQIDDFKKNKLLITNIRQTGFGKQFEFKDGQDFSNRERFNGGSLDKLFQRIFDINQIKYSENCIDQLDKTIEYDKKTNTYTIGINLGEHYNADGRNILTSEYMTALRYRNKLSKNCNIKISPTVEIVDYYAFDGTECQIMDLSDVNSDIIIRPCINKNVYIAVLKFPKSNVVFNNTVDDSHAETSRKNRNQLGKWDGKFENVHIGKVVSNMYNLALLHPAYLQGINRIEDFQITDIDSGVSFKTSDDTKLVMNNLSKNAYFQEHFIHGQHYCYLLLSGEKFYQISAIEASGLWQQHLASDLSFPVTENVNKFTMRQLARGNNDSDPIVPRVWWMNKNPNEKFELSIPLSDVTPHYQHFAIKNLVLTDSTEKAAQEIRREFGYAVTNGNTMVLKGYPHCCINSADIDCLCAIEKGLGNECNTVVIAPKEGKKIKFSIWGGSNFRIPDGKYPWLPSTDFDMRLTQLPVSPQAVSVDGNVKITESLNGGTDGKMYHPLVVRFERGATITKQGVGNLLNAGATVQMPEEKRNEALGQKHITNSQANQIWTTPQLTYLPRLLSPKEKMNPNEALNKK